MAELSCTIDVRNVPEVKAEIARLRGLVKDAEWLGWSAVVRVDRTDTCCPWCGALKGEKHVECAAFTPDGVVR